MSSISCPHCIYKACTSRAIYIMVSTQNKVYSNLSLDFLQQHIWEFIIYWSVYKDSPLMLFKTLTFPSTQTLLIGKAALACLLTSSLWQKKAPCRIQNTIWSYSNINYYLPLADLILLSRGFKAWRNLHHFFLSVITNICKSIYSRYSVNDITMAHCELTRSTH